MGNKKMGAKGTELDEALNALKNQKNVAKTKKTGSPIIQKVKEKKKPGRNSYKKEGIEYVKIGATIQKKTKQEMKKALLLKFDGKYHTQDELIDAAILEFCK